MVPVKRYRHEPVRARIGWPGHPVVGLVTRWSAWSPIGRPGHLLVDPVTCWSLWPLKTRLLLTTQHRRPKYKAKVE